MAPPFFSKLAKSTTDLLTDDYGNPPTPPVIVTRVVIIVC